jgi:hypothetical protein
MITVTSCCRCEVEWRDAAEPRCFCCGEIGTPEPLAARLVQPAPGPGSPVAEPLLRPGTPRLTPA